MIISSEMIILAALGGFALLDFASNDETHNSLLLNTGP